MPCENWWSIIWIMNAANDSVNRFLICLVIAGFLHLLILWGVSFPTTSVSDNSIELKIKWAPNKMKEKRKQLADRPIETRSAQKHNADIIRDNQNTSSSTQLRKSDNFFFWRQISRKKSRKGLPTIISRKKRHKSQRKACSGSSQLPKQLG